MRPLLFACVAFLVIGGTVILLYRHSPPPKLVGIANPYGEPLPLEMITLDDGTRCVVLYRYSGIDCDWRQP